MKRFLYHICLGWLMVILASFYVYSSSGDPALASFTTPLQFTENKGQIVDGQGKPRTDILFSGRKNGVTFYLTRKGIVYTWSRSKAANFMIHQVHMELIGANPKVKVMADDQVQEIYNYYTASHTKGIRQVRSYRKVVYQEIYPHVDFVIYTNGSDLKYDFIVKPGGRVQDIQFTYKGNKRLQLQKNGSLLISNPLGKLTEGIPFSYQQVRKDTAHIQSAYRLEKNIVSFQVGAYDTSQVLIIDPALGWANTFGGNQDDIGLSITTDPEGNVYITGNTNSTSGTGLSSSNGYKQTFGGESDAFITKFNTNGERVWSTYYGGDDDDKASGIIVDKAGHVYIAGETLSKTDIVRSTTGSTIQQPNFGGGGNNDRDAFLAKFDSNGQPIWCTYYGGDKDDLGLALTVDASGNVYLCGQTRSENSNSSATNIIAINGFKNYHGIAGSQSESDAFLVKFTPSGQRIWGTYYGGNTRDLATNIVFDPNNYIYISGYTASQSTGNSIENISQVSAGNTSHQPTKNSDFDAFLAKFDLSGNVIWATYYGGNGLDQNDACVVDKEGNVYLCGSTRSNELISTLNTPVATLGSTNRDGFIVKFSSTGERLWGTYVGGEADDPILGVQIDKDENLMVAGTTYSLNNINLNGFQTTKRGDTNNSNDLYIAKFDPATGQKLWGTYYGADGKDWCNDMAIDRFGNMYLTGNTTSSTGFVKNVPGYPYGGMAEVLLVKIDDIAPTVSQLTPRDNTANITISSILKIVFNEYINKSTGKITITINQGSQVIEIPVSDDRITISGDTVIIALSEQFSVGDIEVKIDGGSFLDLAGNPFAGIEPGGWNFTKLPPLKITPTSFEPIPVKHTGSEIVYENINKLSIQLTPNPAETIVKLHTRGITAAETEWQTEEVTPTIDTYEKVIPLDKIDRIGLEYKFEVIPPAAYGPAFTTNTGIVYINHAEGLKITLEKGSSQTNYQLISIPLTLLDSNVSQVIESKLGGQDIEKWRLYRYRSDLAQYEEYKNSSSAFTTIEIGSAYWIIAREGGNFFSGPGSTVKVLQTKPYVISLTPGWNLIGNPYDMNVSWLDVQLYNLDVVPDTLDMLYPYEGEYPPNGGDLMRYRGGFIWADEAVDIKIPVLLNKDLNARLSAERPLYDKNSVFEVNFTLESNTMRYRLGGLGMHPSASTGKDRYDRYLLPRFTDYLEIRFAAEIEKTPGFTKQMVPIANEYTWEFTVETNQPSQLTELKWENYIPAPDGRQLYLYDVQQEKIINMLDQQKYTFHSGTSTLFRVYYGSPLYISKHLRPQRIKLNQNVPNPFRGETLIPFSLPDDRSEYTVEASIYNTTGANVAELARGKYQPGFHQLTWNGKDAKGNPLPAGLYIARLVVAEAKQTKEMFIRIIIQ